MAKKKIINEFLLKNFGDNFNEAMDAAGVPQLHRGRVKWVAEQFGVSPSAARKWCHGEMVPMLEHLMRIATTLNVSLDALIYDDSKAQAGRTVSATIGITSKHQGASDQFQALSTVKFEALWLRKAMSINPLGLFLMVVEGDYMSPTLNNGDTIFIDTLFKKLQDNGIYVLLLNKRILVRRLAIQDDHSIQLLCDNKKHPPKHHKGAVIIEPSSITEPDKALLHDTKTLVVLGKVQWSMKRVADLDLSESLTPL